MNERPQRDESADRGPRKRNDDQRRDYGQRRDGGQYRDGGQRRDGGARSGDDRGSRYSNGDRPRRDDRGQRRDFGDRDDRRPRRDGDFRDDRRPRRDGDDRRGGERGGYQGGVERRPSRGGERDFRGDRRDDRGGDGGGERRPYRGGEGGQERRPRREGDFRDDRRPRRDGDDRAPRRDGDFRRDGDSRGDRGDRRDGGFRGDRTQGGRQESYGRGGTRGGGRSDRGGREREYTEAERLQHELRPVRAEHQDPVIPDDIRPNDLHPAARNELKTLQVDVQERVARHLAMVALLIDDDPALAHQHALSASRRAGRIPVARETLAVTAYRTGDFALALRELRTYRRLSGLDGHLALMVDSERGLGRPEKALETGLEADTSKLDTEQRVHLAIAMSGARLDLGQTQQALFELEIPELNPQRAFSWSPELFGAYAAVLEDLGRDDEAREWYGHADRAAGALQDHLGSLDELEVFEIHEFHEDIDAAEEIDSAESADTESDAAAEQQNTVHTDTDTDTDTDAAPTADTESPVENGEPGASTAEDEIAAEVAELLAEAGIGEASQPENTEDRS